MHRDGNDRAHGSVNVRFLAVVAAMLGFFALMYAFAQFTVAHFGQARVQLVEEGTLAPIEGAVVALQGMTGDAPGPGRKPIRLKFLPEAAGHYRAGATVMGTYTLVVQKEGYELVAPMHVELKSQDHKDLGRVAMRRVAPPPLGTESGRK